MTVAAAVAGMLTGCGMAPSPMAVTHDYAARQADAVALQRAVELVTELHYAEAAAALGPLIDRFETAGAADSAAQTTFWLAYCKEKLGQTAAAAALYRTLQARYPDTPAARQAAVRLAQLSAVL